MQSKEFAPPPALLSRAQASVVKTSRLYKEVKQSTWKLWLEAALAKGASKAHAWTNKDNLPPVGLVRPASDGSLSPAVVLSDEHAKWQGRWVQCRNTTEAFEQLKELAKAEDFSLHQYEELLAPSKLKGGATELRTNSSSDGVAMDWLASLPHLVLSGLSKVFLSWLQQVHFEPELFQNWLFLLAKKLGGFRTIGLQLS